MKPNVILITSDQQRKDSMGCYGSDFVHTPNLDKMALEGVRFNRAYCTNPVCTPSRASIYSGCYVSRHGAWNVGTAISEEGPLLSHILKGNGYRTHHIGKAHFQPYSVKAETSMETLGNWELRYPKFTGPYYGFDTVEIALGHATYGIAGHYGDYVKQRTGRTQFDAYPRTEGKFGGEAYDWDIPEELHNSFWTADRSIAYIREAAEREEPFFLSIGFQDPHHPHAVPVERARRIDESRIPLPSYREGELNDKPEHFQAVREGRWNRTHPLYGRYPMAGQGGDAAGYLHVSDQDARLGRAYYYTMVEMIDDAMGQILRALDESGLAENTIVVFTSDHGELLGDHGIWMKGPFHYEALINVPLILMWKGKLLSGSCSDSIVSLADLVPTLLSLCGMAVEHPMDGVDLSPLCKGAEDWNGAAPRQRALIECIDDPHHLRLKTLVSERYKLTVYYGDYGRETGELYDLQNDPGEICNLWDAPEMQPVKIEMLQALLWELESIETRRERKSYC